MFETQMTIVFTHRPYTVPGKCNVVPDTACAIGSESSLASVLKNCNWKKWYYPHWKIWAKNIFLSLEYSGLNIISSQISLAAGTVATMAPVALIVWPTRIARRDRWGYMDMDMLDMVDINTDKTVSFAEVSIWSLCGASKEKQSKEKQPDSVWKTHLVRRTGWDRTGARIYIWKQKQSNK